MASGAESNQLRERHMSNVQTDSTIHDVVIVGSGAGGGTVTKVLADAGINVLLMEAGPMVGMARLRSTAEVGLAGSAPPPSVRITAGPPDS